MIARINKRREETEREVYKLNIRSLRNKDNVGRGKIVTLHML